MEGRLARRAETAPGEPAQQLGLGHVEIDDAIERHVELAQQPLQCVSLGNRPWKAVEDEAPLGVGLGQPLGDEPDDHVVGYQRAPVHEGLGLSAEGRAVGDGLAQHVARRHLRNAPLASELASLGALAGAGRSEEDEAHSGLSPARTRPSASATA